VYHISGRGNERKTIYRSEAGNGRIFFLELLAGMVELSGSACTPLSEWIIIPSAHRAERANLKPAVQWLNVSYSVWFNRSTGGPATFPRPLQIGCCQSRGVGFKPQPVYSPQSGAGRQTGLGKADGNDARGRGGRARLGGGAAAHRAAAQHRWSSYRAYIGLAAKPVWLDAKPY